MAVAQHNEHSFDLDLLLSVPNPVAIDVGCRGFNLAGQLAPLGVTVYSLDIDGGVAIVEPLAYTPLVEGFRRVAMLGESELNRRGTLAPVARCGDPSATCIGGDGGRAGEFVPTTSLARFLTEMTLLRVDLPKLDCEGSEYGIIEDIARSDFPMARQVTVEYHDHCGKMPPGGPMWFDQITALLSRNYEIVKHHRETPPWGGQPSFVDCLYIAREW